MKKTNIYGMPLPIFLFFGGVIVICSYLNIVPTELLSAFAVLSMIGIVLGELGDRLPIWRDYIGGGALLVFIGAGLLNYFNLLPACVVDNANGWIDEYSFLNAFICFLIVGSLIGMDRKVLIKSGTLFIPAILASIAGSALLGVLAGFLIGKSPLEMITAYVLPIMGGGAGAGAIPMARVYGSITGADTSEYLSFALAILSLGNIISILMAVVLNLIGQRFPALAGGNQLVRNADKEIFTDANEDELPVTVDDLGAAIFVTSGFFLLGELMAEKVLPSVMGVSIPSFAYIILLSAFANILGLIPENIRRGLVKCQQFCSKKLVWIQMAGMAISAISFDTMLSVLSPGNIFAVVMIVIGAVIGAAVFGWLVGFYPIESGITAGLCMANMGGAGDLAVLGASKRMGLMGYAQISSRIGGAIILLIGSLAFSFL